MIGTNIQSVNGVDMVGKEIAYITYPNEIFTPSSNSTVQYTVANGVLRFGYFFPVFENLVVDDGTMTKNLINVFKDCLLVVTHDNNEHGTVVSAKLLDMENNLSFNTAFTNKNLIDKQRGSIFGSILNNGIKFIYLTDNPTQLISFAHLTVHFIYNGAGVKYI